MSKRPPEILIDAHDPAYRMTEAEYADIEKDLTLVRRVAAHAARHATRETGAGEVSPRLIGDETITLVCRDGKPLEVPKRRGYGGSHAFIDWLNVTMMAESFEWDYAENPDHSKCAASASVHLERIFGLPITCNRSKGANFYEHSYEIGNGHGLFCIGGQRDTCLISISGSGCAAAKPGWEKRLHEFLTLKAIRPRISRVDLAHDDYEGVYSVDRADADYEAGLFKQSAGGRMPEVEHRGNWRRPSGKGRTLYIGHRRNGRFCRVYEKGKQLGDVDSTWTRIEVEYKSVDKEIPFDVLLLPGEYLAASYPALGFIDAVQARIETKSREVKQSYKKMIEWLRTAAGPAIHFACEIEGDLNRLFSMISRQPKNGRFPRSILHATDWESFTVSQPAASAA